MLEEAMCETMELLGTQDLLASETDEAVVSSYISPTKGRENWRGRAILNEAAKQHRELDETERERDR